MLLRSLRREIRQPFVATIRYNFSDDIVNPIVRYHKMCKILEL